MVRKRWPGSGSDVRHLVGKVVDAAVERDPLNNRDVRLDIVLPEFLVPGTDEATLAGCGLPRLADTVLVEWRRGLAYGRKPTTEADDPR